MLDIGCASGANGKYLMDQGMISYMEGVELDPEMVAVAKKRMDKIVVGDVESAECFSKISSKLFDYIIISDVLEYLYDPWKVLCRLSKMLGAKGKLIFSLPNIGHINVFIQILSKDIGHTMNAEFLIKPIFECLRSAMY